MIQKEAYLLGYERVALKKRRFQSLIGGDMTNRYTEITLILNPEESSALRNSAELNLRRPRDQARYLLRSILLGEQDGMNNRHDAKELTGQSITAVAGIHP